MLTKASYEAINPRFCSGSREVSRRQPFSSLTTPRLRNLLIVREAVSLANPAKIAISPWESGGISAKELTFESGHEAGMPAWCERNTCDMIQAKTRTIVHALDSEVIVEYHAISRTEQQISPTERQSLEGV